MRSVKKLPGCGAGRRRGFTLVELMVVVAIIGVLAALTTAAAMQVMSYQRSSMTEGTIKTISSLLDRQWQAVIAQADKEEIPDRVRLIAGGNEKRARVIWRKLRLKQAFPMNFTEALDPWKIPVPGAPLQAPDLPGLQAYRSAIVQSRVIPNTTDPLEWAKESSACLLMALQMGRGGISFTEDSISPNALSSKGIGLRQFVDAWGNPLVFYRWATANGELDNSNPAGPYVPSEPKTWNRDPLDPEGLLLDPLWNNYENLRVNRQGVWWFENYCHLVHQEPINPRAYKPRSYYLIPVIASAGRDGILGLRQPPPNSPLLPDPMEVDLMRGGSNDNIYSFRLRLGARGDQ